MRARPVLSALLDLAAGLVAITLVVGSSFAFKRVAFDFRALFEITGLLFFAAGFLRGSANRIGYAWRLVRVSLPGLLGIGVMILNTGLHRLAIPAGLIVISVFAVAAGLKARASWAASRSSGLVLGCGALAVISAVSVLLVPVLSSRAAFVASSEQLPGFELSTDAGKISSTDLRGRVVVMAFWAGWCAPCIEEMPHIQQVYRHYEHDNRVAFYAVDVGWHGETSEAGKRSFARHGFDVPVAFDKGDVAQSLQIDSLPTVVLIDGSGRVRFIHNGYERSENMEAGLAHHIDDLLVGG
jgi:thiol-disulfide isomerase/thioredoxin